MVRDNPKTEPVPMKDRRIHRWKPLIVVTLFLWCMESVPGAVGHSGGMEQKATEIGTKAPGVIRARCTEGRRRFKILHGPA